LDKENCIENTVNSDGAIDPCAIYFANCFFFWWHCC